MSRALLVRILETFFRRWWLYLLPLLLLVGAGVRSVSRIEPVHRSYGTLYVQSETFLSSLTAVRDGDIGWNTPASFFDEQLSGLLQTDAFLREVGQSAGLDPSGYLSPAAMLADIRASVSSWPSGDNLVQVTASHRDPAVARDLAAAVVDRFVQWQIDSDANGSTVAEAFFSDLVRSYEQAVVASRDALSQYLVQNPDPQGGGSRPLAQRVVIDRLTGEVAAAEERLEGGRAKAEEARLATAQVESDVRQRLRMVDVPELATAPDPVTRTIVLNLGLFTAMGAVLSAAALVTATVLDRSVRSRLDVTQSLSGELLAVVPEQRVLGRHRRWRGAGA